MKIIRLVSLVCTLLALTAIPVTLLGKPSLRGSKESQNRQNNEAKKEDLTRLQNDAQLERMKKQKLLIPLPTNAHLEVDDKLAEKLRYCRPWTRTFLLDFSRNFHIQFTGAGPIKVNSAVRTEDYQKQLRKHNGNGAKVSSHVVGSTVDIAKTGHSKAELNYMRQYLLNLEKRGLIEATEEHKQPVFHVMIFKNYVAKKVVKKKTP